MTQDQTLYEILYCSTLVQDLSPRTVGAIVSQARGRNAEHGITGLLVLDGLRFCQHLEGPREAVQALMQRIERDPRHVDVRIAYEGGDVLTRLAAKKHFYDCLIRGSGNEALGASLHLLNARAMVLRGRSLQMPSRWKA